MRERKLYVALVLGAGVVIILTVFVIGRSSTPADARVSAAPSATVPAPRLVQGTTVVPENSAPVRHRREIATVSHESPELDAGSQRAITIELLKQTWTDEQGKHDSDWTENTETYFCARLESMDAGCEIVRNADCRSTVCRVFLEMKDTAALLALSGLVVGERQRFQYEVQRLDGGSFVIAYLLREGR